MKGPQGSRCHCLEQRDFAAHAFSVLRVTSGCTAAVVPVTLVGYWTVLYCSAAALGQVAMPAWPTGARPGDQQPLLVWVLAVHCVDSLQCLPAWCSETTGYRLGGTWVKAVGWAWPVGHTSSSAAMSAQHCFLRRWGTRGPHGGVLMLRKCFRRDLEQEQGIHNWTTIAGPLSVPSSQ